MTKGTSTCPTTSLPTLACASISGRSPLPVRGTSHAPRAPLPIKVEVDREATATALGAMEAVPVARVVLAALGTAVEGGGGDIRIGTLSLCTFSLIGMLFGLTLT